MAYSAKAVSLNGTQRPCLKELILLVKRVLHRVRMMFGVSSIVPNINTERVKGIP